MTICPFDYILSGWYPSIPKVRAHLGHKLLMSQANFYILSVDEEMKSVEWRHDLPILLKDNDPEILAITQEMVQKL